jgi:dTDP-glucose 4,6-dehydratase
MELNDRLRPSASADEYSPRCVLVTGGCGFIGSNFINYFTSSYPGVPIVNLDRMDYCADRKNVVDRSPAWSPYKLVVGDVNNAELVRHVLVDNSVDTVVHFAAQSHVDASFGCSLQFTRDNVLGTHTLLESCREYGGVRRFVHISTDEVYGEVQLDHPGCTAERSLLNPTNPYAATKAAAEFIARSYYYSFKLPVIITRGNNVYGPRQYPEKVVPRFVEQVARGQAMTVHGHGDARRNFIHVLDVVRAVDVILRRGAVNSIYNIGTQNELSVLEVAEKVLALMRPGASVQDHVVHVPDRNFNDFRYAIDSAPLRALGWSEGIAFDDGLRQTVGWYTDRLQKEINTMNDP